MSFPGERQRTPCHNVCWGNLQREGLLSSRFHFIADLALYPLPEINLSQEDDYMLNPVSPQESQNLEVAWGSPTQISYSFSPLFRELYPLVLKIKLILNSWIWSQLGLGSSLTDVLKLQI